MNPSNTVIRPLVERARCGVLFWSRVLRCGLEGLVILGFGFQETSRVNSRRHEEAKYISHQWELGHKHQVGETKPSDTAL